MSIDNKVNDKEIISTYKNYSEARQAAKAFVNFKELKTNESDKPAKSFYKEIAPDTWRSKYHTVIIELSADEEKQSRTSLVSNKSSKAKNPFKKRKPRNKAVIAVFLNCIF
jgi:predicted acetyltransferase